MTGSLPMHIVCLLCLFVVVRNPRLELSQALLLKSLRQEAGRARLGHPCWANVRPVANAAVHCAPMDPRRLNGMCDDVIAFCRSCVKYHPLEKHIWSNSSKAIVLFLLFLRFLLFSLLFLCLFGLKVASLQLVLPTGSGTTSGGMARYVLTL